MRPLALERLRPADVEQFTAFLTVADLTLSGLDDPNVRLWLLRGTSGEIIGSTGYELSNGGADAIVRSVAVSPGARGGGIGTRLATHAIDAARSEGVARAWLFSRRSGAFWQGLGFEPANRNELAEALIDTHQVRLFRESGQLATEVAWSRAL